VCAETRDLFAIAKFSLATGRIMTSLTALLLMCDETIGAAAADTSVMPAARNPAAAAGL